MANLEQSLRDVASTREPIDRVQTCLATLQLAIDNIKEELVELKALAVSNNVLCNGKLTWPVRDVGKRFEDARLGRMVRIFSPPFYSKPDGYKMCVCLYLNGCGAGQGTHLSVFFALMKGEYDPSCSGHLNTRSTSHLLIRITKRMISIVPSTQQNWTHFLDQPMNWTHLVALQNLHLYQSLMIQSMSRMM